MTEEIIKSITVMEAEAEQIKTDAQNKAAVIIAEAEQKAAQAERLAADERKAYREKQYQNALAEADVEYEKTVAEKLRDAKGYCEEALNASEAYVGKIVGRIIGGDR